MIYLGLAGWVLGALGLGLWWGERGRAKAFLELYHALAASRGVPITKPVAPTVVQTYPDPQAAAAKAMNTEVFDGIRDDRIAQGWTLEAAEAEATDLVQQLNRGAM